MKVKEMVPQIIRERIKLFILRRKYPTAKISSPHVGDGVQLSAYSSINKNVIIGKNSSLGKYSYINNNTIIGEGVTIGNYCSIAYGCYIGLNEHPVNYISTSPWTYGRTNIFGIPSYWNEFASPPEIGNDVWIGAGAIILQGTKIGNGAVIAAGAVVTKDVPPYTIAGGVPARVIKSRFTSDEIKTLSQLKWWDIEVEELKNYKDYFIEWKTSN